MKHRQGFVSNSSSEAFILRTNKSTEQVKEELQGLIAWYQIASGDLDMSYEEVFQDPRLATLGDLNYLEENWDYKPYATDKNEWLMKIILYSAGDNSIPWGMIGLVEDAYNADRIHLG
uniref:Uncharacterized protein n=1 Tax=viral metagenome TaxID=1070528 RepID=A0A6M3IRM5_9ZZZZ